MTFVMKIITRSSYSNQNQQKYIIDTEFELYFQSIYRYLNDIPDSKIKDLKTKLRYICDRYNRIRVPYIFRKKVEKLSRNYSIMVLKQDKGRGVIVM